MSHNWAPPRKLAEELPAGDLRVCEGSASSLGQLWRAIPATRLHGIHWHPCCDHITAQLLLLPNFASFTPLLMFPEPCPGSHLRTLSSISEFILCRPQPCNTLPQSGKLGACYSFLGSPLPLQVFMSKQQWLGPAAYPVSGGFWFSPGHQSLPACAFADCGESRMTLPWPFCPSSGRQERIQFLPWEGEPLL